MPHMPHIAQIGFFFFVNFTNYFQYGIAFLFNDFFWAKIDYIFEIMTFVTS